MTRTIFLCLLMIILWAYVALFAQSEITLDVYPRLYSCLYETTLRVRWQIEPHVDNRAYTLAWWSEEGRSGLTWRMIEGDKAAKTYTLFVDIACVPYVFQACVYRWVDGKSVSFCDRQEVEQ